MGRVGILEFLKCTHRPDKTLCIIHGTQTTLFYMTAKGIFGSLLTYQIHWDMHDLLLLGIGSGTSMRFQNSFGFTNLIHNFIDLNVLILNLLKLLKSDQ